MQDALLAIGSDQLGGRFVIRALLLSELEHPYVRDWSASSFAIRAEPRFESAAQAGDETLKITK